MLAPAQSGVCLEVLLDASFWGRIRHMPQFFSQERHVHRSVHTSANLSTHAVWTLSGLSQR